MHHRSLVFWSQWIKFLNFFLIIYGLAMVFTPSLMNQTFVVPLLYSDNPLVQTSFTSMTITEQHLLATLSGLLGTVTVGWAIQMMWTAHVPFRHAEPWAWNALTLSLCSWALLEFYFKWVGGISGMGLFAHFGLLIAYGIPLFATFTGFHSKSTRVITGEDAHEAGDTA